MVSVYLGIPLFMPVTARNFKTCILQTYRSRLSGITGYFYVLAFQKQTTSSIRVVLVKYLRNIFPVESPLKGKWFWYKQIFVWSLC